MTNSLSPRLATLIDELNAMGSTPGAEQIRAALERAQLDLGDVTPFVRPGAHSYRRVRVARTEAYELLVMTWQPGQASAPHDHAGSNCCLRVVLGSITESQFAIARDGLVDCVKTSRQQPGGVVVDNGVVIHTLGNDEHATENLVTVHVYAPPLPELRRYVLRSDGVAVAEIFNRKPDDDTPRVAIMGGGFSGTMTAAHLIHNATMSNQKLHLMMIDRQAAFGEGVAYRTNDLNHLLNVPAAKMSAFPDLPDDFLRWAQARDGRIKPSDFLPRKWYGQYIRETFMKCAASAGQGVSAEIIKDEVISATRLDFSWRLQTERGAVLAASALVLAVGHRPPDDPFGAKWQGSRARLVDNAWSSLAISAIGGDEPVVILGTGLTAVDTILSLASTPRSAPIFAISRRGLMPAAHARAGVAPADLSREIARWMARPKTLSLARCIRSQIKSVTAAGGDWRSVIDGLRPHTSQVWQALSTCERRRFLRSLRPYWEIHRHRMAPAVADQLRGMISEGKLRIIAGQVDRVDATANETSVHVKRRACSRETIRAGWVINCTGPGVGTESKAVAVIKQMIADGLVMADDLALGILCTLEGIAIDRERRPQPGVVVVGTLRKPDLWESTAVPELRSQAVTAARTISRMAFSTDAQVIKSK
ncbi:MAG TPA: FAD/NAD(P)-binding protein [Tepidisphaeraceae bacterium]|nr:FAD/NAD(P)-binding protein [Tepidisphaeraceae bacterium]